MQSAAFTEYLASPCRNLSLSGEMTLPTGSQLSFGGEQIFSFFQSIGSGGQLLGGAFSAACTLLLHNGEDDFTPYSLLGAKVQLYLSAGEERAPLACFFVTEVSHQAERRQITLQGSDALGVIFEAPFADDFSYPLSLGQLAANIAALGGYTLLDTDFPNSEIMIAQRPKWGEISLRRALAFAAGAAGCFVLMDRQGQLIFKRAWPDILSLPVSAGQILKAEGGEKCFGPLSALRIASFGAPREAEALLVKEGEDAPGSVNCLLLSGNPLLAYQAAHTQALAEGMLSLLSGMSLSPGKLTWRGRPDVMLGDRLPLILPSGEQREMLVTRQSLTFSQGFWMQSECAIRENSQKTGGLLTASGDLNATRLSGEINGALIGAGSIAAASLAAGSITANQLAAAAVTAEKIAAGAIQGRHIAARSIQADQLSVDSVEAEHLSAGALDAAAAHIFDAEIDWAQVQSLQAAIAEITQAEVQQADIDFARIRDLTADTAIITRGTAGELYISRLAVTEANLLSLTVGQLVVKGEDGAFYAVTVDENGAVQTEKKQIANDDIKDLSIHAGEKLMEGTVTAATLNAQEIFGESALIRQLIAASLDVDTLFAREAVIQKINALDITGNESIRLYVKTQEEMNAYLRVTENGLEIGRVGDSAVFRADNRTLEVTNIKAERLGIAQRMSMNHEWAFAAYSHGLSLKWLGNENV